MGASEKLDQMLQNVPEVYHSGQLEVIKNAECLKGFESGASMLLDNVSPVEHTMEVYVTSNTVTDFTAVKVRKCGKNLFDISKIRNYGELTNNGDGTLTMKANAQAFTIYEKLSTLCPTLKVGDKIYFNFVSQSTKNFIYLLDSKRSLATYTNPFTVAQADLDSRLVFYGYQSTETNYGNPCTISNIQIEYGTAITEYEPYIPPTEYTPNADGTVGGVTSLYPNTTLITDTDGVIIDCNYYKDISKTFDKLTTSVALSGGDS